MRWRLTVVALLVSVAVVGTFAYRAQAQQRLPAQAEEQRLIQQQRAISNSRLLLVDSPAQQAPAAAPAPAPVQPPGPVQVLTFVDITPLNREAGTVLCKQYVTDTRRDPGIGTVEVLAQTNRPNHLVIHQVWQNLASFERHEAAPHTIAFRTKLLPMMGSPFDQRLHYLVP